MPTTSNFGWTTPADTDLVKDGAAAIRTLGNGIDTSLIDLKGGTTGQILSKASNTDLDYSWVTPNVGDITEVQAGTGISVASGTGPIPVVTNTVATTFDAKGDLVVGTGADTFEKLTVGTNGHTLVADSATSTGLKWAAPSAGKLVQSSFTSSATTFSRTTAGTTTMLTLTITPTLNTSTIALLWNCQMWCYRSTSTGTQGFIKFTNGTTTKNAALMGWENFSVSSGNAATVMQSGGMIFYTSPATSSTTYSMQLEFNNGGLIEVDNCHFGVLEIGA